MEVPSFELSLFSFFLCKFNSSICTTLDYLLDEGDKFKIPVNKNVELTPGPQKVHPKYQTIKDSLMSRNQKEAKKRIFVESSDGEFFGLNTTIFRTDGLIGGMYKKLANYYDDTAKVDRCQQY